MAGIQKHRYPRMAEYANILQGLLEKDSIKKRLLKDSDLKKGLTYIDDDLTMNEVTMLLI